MLLYVAIYSYALLQVTMRYYANMLLCKYSNAMHCYICCHMLLHFAICRYVLLHIDIVARYCNPLLFVATCYHMSLYVTTTT